MSRKQYKPHVGSHERKLSKKERKAQLEQNRPQEVLQEEVVPTEEDTIQIKNLALYSVIGISLVLILMYWLFMNSL